MPHAVQPWRRHQSLQTSRRPAVHHPCRSRVRSEARYIASFERNITGGTGFVTTLALIAKFREF